MSKAQQTTAAITALKREVNRRYGTPDRKTVKAIADSQKNVTKNAISALWHMCAFLAGVSRQAASHSIHTTGIMFTNLSEKNPTGFLSGCWEQGENGTYKIGKEQHYAQSKYNYWHGIGKKNTRLGAYDLTNDTADAVIAAFNKVHESKKQVTREQVEKHFSTLVA